MKIYNEVIIDMHTGDTIYEDSYEYYGDMMLLQDYNLDVIPDMNDDGESDVLDVVKYIALLGEQGYTQEQIKIIVMQGIQGILNESDVQSFESMGGIEGMQAGLETRVGIAGATPPPQVFTSSPVAQASMSASPAPGATKSVLEWSSFWSDANVPVIGYDGVDNNLVILKGADHSADSSKDLRVFNLTNGTWTKGDTKFSGSTDISNMITAPDTNELVAMHLLGDSTAANHLKRFKAHQVANISSSTVNIVTPFFDFGSSGNSKRLYKVKVLCHGTNLDDLRIFASYDGDTDTYASIFTANIFANTSAADWDVQTFTVSAPTDFVNVSIKIYSAAAMTTANWGISEISFIYREKGYR